MLRGAKKANNKTAVTRIYLTENP